MEKIAAGFLPRQFEIASTLAAECDMIALN